jgi:hypothetical protein
VKRDSKEVLYQEQFAYGYENRALKAVTIAADQQYFFKDFDGLTKQADRALEGMRQGLPLVAKRIAQDLAR